MWRSCTRILNVAKKSWTSARNKLVYYLSKTLRIIVIPSLDSVRTEATTVTYFTIQIFQFRSLSERVPGPTPPSQHISIPRNPNTQHYSTCITNIPPACGLRSSWPVFQYELLSTWKECPRPLFYLSSMPFVSHLSTTHIHPRHFHRLVNNWYISERKIQEGESI